MSDGGPLEVEFTTVLYSVVIAFTIDSLTFAVELRNFMLLFAFAIILGDWVEYQIDTREVPPTPANYAVAFVLDIVLLITWYFLTVVEGADLEWFFAIAAAFFILQAFWDRLLLGYSLTQFLWRPEPYLATVFAVLSWFHATFNIAAPLAVGVAAVVFLTFKIPLWHQLIKNSPDAL